MDIDAAIKRLTIGEDEDLDAEWKAAIELGTADARAERLRAAAALTAALCSGRAHALIRAHAVESLGRLALPRSVSLLIEALADPYQLVRSYAAAALGRLNAAAVEPLLRSVRGDEFFGARAEAAKALGQLALRHRDASLRKRIYAGLETARRREIRTGAEGAERVRSEIDRALSVPTPRGSIMNELDKLITELHESELDDPDRQFNAAIALGRNHDLVVRPRIVAELIKALRPGHQALSRAHASEALGEIRDATAIPALIEALKDPYRLVRSYAARALGKMDCVESSTAIDPLIAVLKKDEFFGARAEAAEALGRVFKCCKHANLGNSELVKRAETAVRQHEQEGLKQLDKRLQRVISETRKAINEIGNAAVGLSDEDKARILADLSAQAEQFKVLQKEAAIRLA